jgi:hypothetical protein
MLFYRILDLRSDVEKEVDGYIPGSEFLPVSELLKEEARVEKNKSGQKENG